MLVCMLEFMDMGTHTWSHVCIYLYVNVCTCVCMCIQYWVYICLSVPADEHLSVSLSVYREVKDIRWKIFPSSDRQKKQDFCPHSDN